MPTRTFTNTELLDLGLPSDCDGGKVIINRMTDKGRWQIHYLLIFRLDSQPEGEAYQTTYSVGATENQDGSPWEFDKTVECVVVRQVPQTVMVWAPKPE